MHTATHWRDLWRPDRLGWQALLLVLLVLAAYVLGTSYRQAQLEQPIDLLYGDMVGYTAALLQSDDPNALNRDLIFGNRHFTTNIQPLYMAALQQTYALRDEDIVGANLLLQTVALAIYLPGMFLLLFNVSRHWPLALAVTVLSSGASVLYIKAQLAVTGTYWETGLPGSQMLAFVLYTAVSTWAALLALVWWFRPGWQGERVAMWRVLLVGLLMSATAYLHVVSFLALAQIMVLLAGVQVLRGKLPWWSVLVFGLGLLPGFLGRLMTSAGVVQGIPFESALLIDEYEIGNLHIFPWGYSRVEPLLVGLFLLHVVLTLLFLWLARRARGDRARQRWRVYLVVLQAIYLFLLLQTSPLLILALVVYGLYRAQRLDKDELDRWLLAFLLLALLAGPFQQMVVHAVWLNLRLTAITGLLFEIARFAHFAYLPFFALAARSLAVLAGPLLRRAWTGPLWLAVALWVLWVDLGALLFVALGLALLTLVALTLWQHGAWREVQMFARQGGRYALAGAALALVLILLVRIPPQEPRRPPLTPTFIEMADWVRQNTPQDSLLHVNNFDRRFRYYTRRAMIIGFNEWQLGLYTGDDPAYLLDVIARLSDIQDDPQRLPVVVAEFGADYIIIDNAQGPALALPVAFSNAEFTVYQLHDST